MDGLKIRQTGNAFRNLVGNSMARVFALTSDETDAVHANLGPVAIVRPGDELFSERALTEHRPLEFMLHGWAAEQQILANGRRQIFRFILPGDIFGLHASPYARVTTVAAISEVRYASIGSAGAERPSFANAVAKIAEIATANSVNELRNHIARLGGLPAHARVADLILELYSRLERVGLVEGVTFEMPLQQEVLADAVGLSTVHTNRVLQRLRGEGLLETRRNSYSLPNLKRLAEIAEYGEPAQPAYPRADSVGEGRAKSA